MWGALLRLFGGSGGTDPVRDRYDPVYGLPRRAVEEWLARNPGIRDEYEAELRARAVRRGGGGTDYPGGPGGAGAGRRRPQPAGSPSCRSGRDDG
jgi:hypothetical protein